MLCIANYMHETQQYEKSPKQFSTRLEETQKHLTQQYEKPPKRLNRLKQAQKDDSTVNTWFRSRLREQAQKKISSNFVHFITVVRKNEWESQ